jgi:hypothetical protein
MNLFILQSSAAPWNFNLNKHKTGVSKKIDRNFPHIAENRLGIFLIDCPINILDLWISRLHVVPFNICMYSTAMIQKFA